MKPGHKRLLAAAMIALGAVVLLELFAYDVYKIEWISFMEIQASYKPMEDPLPVPPDSIPVEGPAYVVGLGVPQNPVAGDDASLARGRELFTINCMQCHGAQGLGNGTISNFIVNKPADLTGDRIKSMSDGAIFITISNGMPGRMPPLNENLTVRERWDVVNYIRAIIQQPTPQP